LPLYQTLTQHWQPVNDEETQNLGWAWTQLAGLHSNLGDYRFTLDTYQQVKALFTSIGDRGGEAASLGNLGNAYQSLGQYQRSIEFHQQSLDIKREIGDRRGEANSHWNLNNTYQQRGRLKLSMHHRHQAYRIWHDMQLPLAAVPFPALTKNMAQNLGDDWAEQLIANEKRMAWFLPPLFYCVFILRTVLSPLTRLQKGLKLHPLAFWFILGIALVLLVAWLR
jgi:tetratricopeptide (TPR) repeat protein